MGRPCRSQDIKHLG